MNPRTGVWQYVTRMSTKRLGVAIAVHNNQLYAIGGEDGKCYLNSIER
jgi:N-acetylneuraminic acid mutarotase